MEKLTASLAAGKLGALVRKVLFLLCVFGALAGWGAEEPVASTPTEPTPAVEEISPSSEAAPVSTPEPEKPEVLVGAAESPPPAREGRFFVFRPSFLLVLQPNGEVISGELAWTPRVALSSQLEWSVVLGATLLKGAGSRDAFVSARYQSGPSFWFTPSFGAEVLFGLQTWFKNGGTNFALGLNGIVPLDWEFFLGSVERLYFGYGHYFLKGNGTHELRVGLGVAL